MRRLAFTLLALVGVFGAHSLAQDRREGALRPGDPAPDFALEPRGGGAPVSLSSFRGRQPVALVFGSYT